MSSKVRSIKREIQRKQATGGITVTLGQLLQSTQSMGVLISQPMPIVKSHEIGKLVRAINLELGQYRESHKTLCEQHAEKDSDGKPRVIAATETEKEHYDIKNLAEFEKELQELIALEVTIPGSHIKVTELGSVSIAPAHLLSLDWLLIE